AQPRAAVVDPDPVVQHADAAHFRGDVLGQVLHPALLHLAGQGDFAAFDLQQDLRGIQVRVDGETVDQLVGDALGGSQVAPGAATAVHTGTVRTLAVAGWTRGAAAVAALRVPPLVLPVAALAALVVVIVAEDVVAALAGVAEGLRLRGIAAVAQRAVGDRRHVLVAGVGTPAPGTVVVTIAVAVWHWRNSAVGETRR